MLLLSPSFLTESLQCGCNLRSQCCWSEGWPSTNSSFAAENCGEGVEQMQFYRLCCQEMADYLSDFGIILCCFQSPCFDQSYKTTEWHSQKYQQNDSLLDPLFLLVIHGFFLDSFTFCSAKMPPSAQIQ